MNESNISDLVSFDQQFKNFKNTKMLDVISNIMTENAKEQKTAGMLV